MKLQVYSVPKKIDEKNNIYIMQLSDGQYFSWVYTIEKKEFLQQNNIVYGGIIYDS